MKYVLLIYQPHPFDPEALPPEEHKSIGEQYGAVTATPGVTPGLPLGLTADAITVRVGENGETSASEGPYVNATGAVGGYLVFEAESREEVIALASRIPAARLGGAIEVRPAQTYW